jgi:membrane protein CcdC involved in cytochrome C biogenesis
MQSQLSRILGVGFLAAFIMIVAVGLIVYTSHNTVDKKLEKALAKIEEVRQSLENFEKQLLQ